MNAARAIVGRLGGMRARACARYIERSGRRQRDGRVCETRVRLFVYEGNNRKIPAKAKLSRTTTATSRTKADYRRKIIKNRFAGRACSGVHSDLAAGGSTGF